MKASNIKGALLEYLVRRLLGNCGFHPVYLDNLYTYVRGDLFYVNGRGAAHDADVLMEPTVQMPFSYPSSFCLNVRHTILRSPFRSLEML